MNNSRSSCGVKAFLAAVLSVLYRLKNERRKFIPGKIRKWINYFENINRDSFVLRKRKRLEAELRNVLMTMIRVAEFGDVIIIFEVEIVRKNPIWGRVIQNMLKNEISQTQFVKLQRALKGRMLCREEAVIMIQAAEAAEAAEDLLAVDIEDSHSDQHNVLKPIIEQAMLTRDNKRTGVVMVEQLSQVSMKEEIGNEDLEISARRERSFLRSNVEPSGEEPSCISAITGTVDGEDGLSNVYPTPGQRFFSQERFYALSSLSFDEFSPLVEYDSLEE